MTRIRRSISLIAALAVLVSAAAASAATPGKYVGRNSDGNRLWITVYGNGKSGLFNFCGEKIRFKISRSTFSVSQDTVSATGRFRGEKVSGKIKPTGCSASSSTYSLPRR